MTLLKVRDVYKYYKLGSSKVKALSDINLDIEKGEIVVVLGPSGSGKTTLLNCLSGLDYVSQGKIYYNDLNIANYSDRKRTRFRKKNLGFIFQNYNLLEHINVYENILIGASLGKNKSGIESIIKTVGLDKHKKKYMHELSGGEQQRVSIARAIAKSPNVLFCDEPTGALDEKTGKKVLQTLIDVNEKLGTTMIIVTHNPGIALIGDRIIKMNSAKIVEDKKNKRVKPVDIPWG